MTINDFYNNDELANRIYFKIGEVSEIVGVQEHVLRFWETEFPKFKPDRSQTGHRTYRKDDVEMAFKIKNLLYEELYTIAGARRQLQKGI